MYAALYRPSAVHDERGTAGGAHPQSDGESATGSARSPADDVDPLLAIARGVSPRLERHRRDLVSIDVSGLERLIGAPRTIGEELRRDAAARGIQVHVALAGTRSAALVLVLARPGLTVVEPGTERASLASLPIAMLDKAYESGLMAQHPTPGAVSLEPLCRRWGIRTLGEFAALPPAELSARIGQHALAWQAVARGEDTAPLVPTLPEERFESSLELDWPIEGLEPLSFVLTRLLEPLSVRLERRDRGTAVLHLELRLVTKETHDRHLQLPSPIRDVRTLRTLLLLDLDSHPPPAAIDRVTIVIDPTPGRVVQHTLFTRAQPAPEQLSTLIARLHALLGQNRIGAPATLDSYRPGAFVMTPFATERDTPGPRRARGARGVRTSAAAASAAFEPSDAPAAGAPSLAAAVRRCRQPVPARAVVEDGRPTRVTTDRRGFPGGRVLTASGPWRTSGDWWAAGPPSWDRDEWDVALADGAVYRIFQDRETDGWFLEAIVD
jgi:protein ImuB